MTESEILGALSTIAFVVFLVGLLVYKVVGTKCPNCGRRKTQQLTGKKRQSDLPGTKTELQMTCTACGRSDWAPKMRWWHLIP